MDSPRRDDLELARAALQGAPDAVEALLDRLLPVVRARTRRVLRRQGTLAHADDVVQDFLLHLWSEGGRRLLAFDPARGASLENYVGLKAESFAVDAARRRGAKKRGGHLFAVGLDDAAPSSGRCPEEAVATRDLVRRLGAHLDDSLPEKGRLVLRYTFADGRPAPEVADILGVRVQVVYNWQHKIRTLARHFLGA